MWVNDSTPLVKIIDKSFPVFFPQVRQENPNTGFPVPIAEELLEPFGYAPVYQDKEKPEGDVVVDGEPVLGEDGKWYRTWIVRDFTEEERLEELKIRKEVLYNRAYGLYSDEIYNGLPIKLGEKEFIFSIDINSILYLKTLISNWDSEVEPILIKGQYTVIALGKNVENKSFVQMLLDNYKLMYRNYLNFLYQTTETLEIKDLPQLPSTFKV